MTNVKALKNLYVALGGSSSTVANMTLSCDVINAIAALITSQGIAALPSGTDGQVLTLVSGEWAAAAVPTELPAVTATENGSVLKVINGAWGIGSDATE